MEYDLIKIPSEVDDILISYSKLQLFDTCPKQYFYRYLTNCQIKSILYPGNVVGRVFHEAIEEAINLKNYGLSDKEIILHFKETFNERYNQEVEKHKEEYKLSNEIKKHREEFFKTNNQLLLQLIKFVISYFYNKNFLILPEQEYSVKWLWDTRITVNGFLDITLKYDTEIDIIDLKVTKDSNTYYFVDWSNNLQNLMYEYFVWKCRGKLPKFFGYFVLNREENTMYFKTKMVPEITDHQEYFKPLHDKIQILKNFIINPDQTLALPDKNKCFLCAYKGFCDYSCSKPAIRKVKNNLSSKQFKNLQGIKL